MSHIYSAVCDDFYLNMRLGSLMPLPHQRDTILHFFEQMQKVYPGLTRFRKGEGQDYSIEEDREASTSYRWISLEHNRVSSGHVNPPDLETALQLHQLVLQRVPYELGVSMVEIDYLDVLLGFDLDFAGNHDEIVIEGLMEQTPLASLLEVPGARPVDFQPSLTFALSDDARLQGRVDIVTRTSSYQLRTGEYNEEAISVYLIMRNFWGGTTGLTFESVALDLMRRAEQMAGDIVIPRIIKPISAAIASRG